MSTRQKYPRVTALVLKRGNRRLAAGWDTVASLEESGVLLRVAASASRARPLSRTSSSCAAGPRQPDRGHRRPQDDPRQRHPARALGRQSLRVVAVDVSSGAILRRIGLARVDHAPVQEPQAAPDRLERRRPAGERRRSRAPVGAAPRPVAAAPGRHRRDRPRAHPRGARRGLRGPGRRGRRRHPRGDAPRLSGLAAQRAARRKGGRPARRRLARRRRRPARRPAQAARPRLLALMDHEKRDRDPRAAHLPRELGRRHHDHRLRRRCRPRSRPAEAIELLRDQEPEVETVYYIYVDRQA